MNSGSTRVWADGLIAGAIGYAVAVIFFVVLDLTTGRSWLFTGTLLGEGLFYGLEDPVQLVPAYGPAIAFNGVHLIGYLAMGVIAAWLAARAEQGAQFWYVATVLFVFGLFHVIAAHYDDLLDKRFTVGRRDLPAAPVRASSSTHASDMGDLPLSDRADAVTGKRHDRQRFTIQRDELHLVSFAPAMHEDNGAEITGP